MAMLKIMQEKWSILVGNKTSDKHLKSFSAFSLSYEDTGTHSVRQAAGFGQTLDDYHAVVSVTVSAKSLAFQRHLITRL